MIGDTNTEENEIFTIESDINGAERKSTRGHDWESGLYAGLMLSLDKYRDRLDDKRAYKLNSKPREIDIRIIDQDYNGSDRMDNAIAYLFERHNLIELKDPYEALDIDTVWKGISYAAQYKSSGYDDITGESRVNAIPIQDVTLTFLRVSKPLKLFGIMKKSGYRIEERFPGVYYITGMADIKMQVVVGRELQGKEFVPLRIQRKNALSVDVMAFVNMAKELKDIRTKELADSVMQISISENRSLYDRLMEESDMCQALRELMNDQIEKEKSAAAIAAASAAASAAITANQEDIAKKMLSINEPLEKISSLTSVSIARLKELAKMITPAPAKGQSVI